MFATCKHLDQTAQQDACCNSLQPCRKLQLPAWAGAPSGPPEGAALKLAVLDKVLPQLGLRQGRQVLAARPVKGEVEAAAPPALHEHGLGQPERAFVLRVHVAVHCPRLPLWHASISSAHLQSCSTCVSSAGAAELLLPCMCAVLWTHVLARPAWSSAACCSLRVGGMPRGWPSGRRWLPSWAMSSRHQW